MTLADSYKGSVDCILERTDSPRLFPQEGSDSLISDNIKRLRENMGLSQAALARKLGVTRASVNAWEMELSSPTAAYLVEMARLFHTTTDDILGLTADEQISLRGMTEQEKRLVYNLIDYISERNKP